MTIFNFGVGSLYGRRTGVDQNGNTITNPTPIQFGAVQDVSVDMSRDLKTLYGQLTYPVDVAGGQSKISGKATLAAIDSGMFNDLFLGQSLTTGSGEQVSVNETTTVATTVNVVHASTFVHDLGVVNKTTGVKLTRVASAPTAGQYSVVETTGVYTFAAADVGSIVNISYSYAVTTLIEIPIVNQFMGISPTFELHLQQSYPNSVSNVVNTMNLKLNACKSSKLSVPFKNVDYTKMEFDFEAFADSSGDIGLWTMVQ